MQRPAILPATYREVFDGNGRDRLFLKNFPVVSVVSVAMDGVAVAAAPALPSWPTQGYGYVLETVDPAPPSRPASLFLSGGCFRRDRQNVTVTYIAGYQVSETQTVSNNALTAQAPLGAWASNVGVVYASTGAALTQVSGSPAQGQFSVNAVGAYAFNTADNGASMTLTYGFIPYDLALAATEWAALRFKSQGFIGLRSKGLGGQETITYETAAMPSFVMAAIQPFKRVAQC